MTGRVEVERILDAFLAPENDQLPDRVIEASLSEIARTPQRRAVRAPWRLPVTASTFRILAAGAAALALVSLALTVGSNRSLPAPTVSGPPSMSPLPTPHATASGLDAPMGYPGEGTIEYTKHDASGEDVLWVVDPSGANPTRLVQGGCCGVFSPNGQQLALAARGIRVAGFSLDPKLMGIEVINNTGLPPQFTVPTGCGACEIVGLNSEPDAWSPDGRFIALSMWSDTDPRKAGMGLADRDFPPFPWDWAQTRATGNHPDIPIAFSPDNEQLLFMRGEETSGPTSTGPLFVLQLADLFVRQISPPGVTVSTNGLSQGPASWSQDGSQVAFAGRDPASGTTSIFVVQSSPGSEANRLVPDAPGATSARFSPDGSLIALDRASADGFHDLYVVRADGSGLTTLTSNFSPGVCCGQWSPDSKALVVAGTTSDDDHNNLFVVAADGSGIWQVTNEPNAYTAFLWGQGFR